MYKYIKKGFALVGVWYKNKEGVRRIQTEQWTVSPEVLIQLWRRVNLTSWRRPPSCRWPSVWVSAPDVWRTQVPANGGPARTSAGHPASRTNPQRSPSHCCRKAGVLLTEYHKYNNNTHFTQTCCVFQQGWGIDFDAHLFHQILILVTRRTCEDLYSFSKWPHWWF